jgi:hypothetical protein
MAQNLIRNAVAKASVKNDQPSALEVYVAGGMNFGSLIGALRSLMQSLSGQAEIDKSLTELLKKLCLSAQGSRYAITLTKAEAPNFLQFLVIACEDTRDAGALLWSLEARPENFRDKHLGVIEAFLTKAQKVVPKLVTHLQKTRNPDSQIEVFVTNKEVHRDWIVGSNHLTRQIAVTNVATPAKLGGQRWFWEATVVVNSAHLQVSNLISTNPDLDWFWLSDSLQILPLPSERLPAFVGLLSHQLLFESPEGGYLSLTPLTSIGSLSQLAAPRIEKAIVYRTQTAKYGGDQPQNIASLLSDRRGFIRHPRNAPWIAPSESADSLLKYAKSSHRLIARLKLSERQIARLFEAHAVAANNAARQSHILRVLEPLLERACNRMLSFRDLFLLDQASATLLHDEHVVSDWIKSAGSFGDSRYSELADFILAAALGPIGQNDFYRWSEMKMACVNWLKGL